jgi:putative transposase
MGEEPDAPWVLSSHPRHAHIAGFDLHANVAVPAADRGRLEQFSRYLLRPPVAQDRLRRLDDARILLTLKTAWADGTRCPFFGVPLGPRNRSQLKGRRNVSAILTDLKGRHQPTRDIAGLGVWHVG